PRQTDRRGAPRARARRACAPRARGRFAGALWPACRGAPDRSRGPRCRAWRSAAASARRGSWRLAPASPSGPARTRTPAPARPGPPRPQAYVPRAVAGAASDAVRSRLRASGDRARRSRIEVPARRLEQHLRADPEALLVHVEAGLVMAVREAALL